MTARNRTLFVAGAAAVATLVVAGPASAHVTVNPNEAPGGGYSKLTFRVPTESDTASTTKLQVVFPAKPAFASVNVKPHPGWTFKVAKKGQNVTSVTWTPEAKADAIKPGEFDEFDISLGPLPDSGTVDFKALQTYSDGSVVRWIEIPKAGQDEPEHPAPILTLTAAADDSGTTATAAPASDDATDSEDSDGGGSTTGPWILSIVGVALGAVALVNSQRRKKA